MIIRGSSMPRAMACHGSVSMEQSVPPAPDTDDSKYGTAAHELSEMVLKGTVGTSAEMIDRQMTNGVVVTGDMAEASTVYTDHVRSRGLPLYVEHTGSIDIGSGVIVEGTTDCGAFDEVNGILYVDDAKFGWRIVEAPTNWQLIVYAMMLMQMFARVNPNGYMNIRQIVMTIIQPHPEHMDGKIRSVTVGRAQFSDYVGQLADFAHKLTTMVPMCQTNDKCRDCAALHSCPTAQKAGMNAVDVSGQAVIDTLTVDALSSELTTLIRAKDMINNRLAALTDLTRDHIKHGRAVPHWGIEESYGHTKWNEGINAEMLELLGGSNCTELKMVTPAAAKRNGVSEETVKSLTTRPFIGHKLVPQDTDALAQKVLD